LREGPRTRTRRRTRRRSRRREQRRLQVKKQTVCTVNEPLWERSEKKRSGKSEKC